MRSALFAVCWVLFAVSCDGAEPVAGSRLVTDPSVFDGRDIEIQGEAVGELMIRGESGWVNINDGETAIGVYAGRELLRAIGHTGRYGVRGDTVSVSGTFNAACRAHGGDMDIHGHAIRIVRPGEGVGESADRRKVTVLFFLTGATGAIWILSRSGRR